MARKPTYEELERRIKELENKTEERERAEGALQKIEAQKGAILNGITSNLALVNGNLEILWANKTSADSVNKSMDEMIGHTCYELWADPNTPCDGCPTIKAFKTEKTEQTIIHTPDGRVWEEKGEPVFDEKGELIGVLEIAHDITLKAHSEQALKDSEAFLKTLIDAIPTPIFFKDRDGKYLGFNTAFKTFLGKTEDQLIGKSVFDIYPPELAKVYHARDDKLFNSGGVQRYDSQMKNAHGNLRDIIFDKAVLTDSKGTVTGQIGTIIDITERKRAEEALQESEKKFSTLFQTSPVYIAFTALDDGCFLNVNDAFTKTTGYQRNEVLGRTPVEIGLWVDPEERARFIKLAQQHGGFHEKEVRFQSKNGDLLHGIWSGEKMELDGKTCLISVLVDVTERRKAQETLRQERDKLRAAIAEIKTLSGLVPICSNCKKIRDDQGYWNQIEKYIGERSNAEFSHGICPECAKKLYPDFEIYDDEGKLI